MKVLIIDTVARERATYLEPYLKLCEELGVDYNRFVWDRKKDGDIEKNGKEILFPCACPDGGGSKVKKVYPFFLLRKALQRVLREGNYTHLILVNTLAAVAIADIVKKNFRGRYIMDIRDYTYEKWGFYRNVVNWLIANSGFTVISSAGFYAFLARSPKIAIVHNISGEECAVEHATLRKGKENIIGFVGYGRYKEENMALLECFANDPRYRFLYAGDMEIGCNLEAECQKRNLRNVEFLGPFDNKKKWEIYHRIDIINSLYGNTSLAARTSVPNRYYDALLYKKPILASKGTFLGELVEKERLGLAVDIFNDDVKKVLEEYIRNFEPEIFEARCNTVLERVMREQKRSAEKMEAFLSGEMERRDAAKAETAETNN